MTKVLMNAEMRRRLLGGKSALASTKLDAPRPAVNHAANQELWQAARDGNLAAIEAALQQGADINSSDESGAGAVYWAVRHKQFDALDMLWKHGAKAHNTTRQGLLQMDVIYNQGQCAVPLLNMGAAVDAIDASGKSARQLAAEAGLMLFDSIPSQSTTAMPQHQPSLQATP